MNLSVPAGTHQQQPGPRDVAGAMVGDSGEAVLKGGRSTPGVCADIGTGAARNTLGGNASKRVWDKREDNRAARAAASTAAPPAPVAAAAQAAVDGPKVLRSLSKLQDQLTQAKGRVIKSLAHFLWAVDKVTSITQHFGSIALQWAAQTMILAEAFSSAGQQIINSVFEDVPEGEMQAEHVEESKWQGYRKKKSQAKRLLLELYHMEACYKELEMSLREKSQQLTHALQQQPCHPAHQPSPSAQATQPCGQPSSQHDQALTASLQPQAVHDPRPSGPPSEPLMAAPSSSFQPVSAAAPTPVTAAGQQTRTRPQHLSNDAPSLRQAPLVTRRGADCEQPGLLEQAVEQEQQPHRKQARVHWAQPELELQQGQHARQQQEASHPEESPGIPKPPLPTPAYPLLPSQQPSQQPLQQHAYQHTEQATTRWEEAPTAQPSTSAAGTSCALASPPAAAQAAAEVETPHLHSTGSHLSLSPSSPSGAHPSFHTPFLPLPPPPTPNAMSAMVVTTPPVHPQPNVAPAQEQSMLSLRQLEEMPKEAQWQWLQSHFPIDYRQELGVQPVPGSHPTHHKHLFHPGLELLGEVLYRAARCRTYEAHVVSTHVEKGRIEMAFHPMESKLSLEELNTCLHWGDLLEKLKEHLDGGGTVVGFLDAWAKKGSKKDPLRSGYYIKDLDLYGDLVLPSAVRQSVESLIAALIPDDILKYHYPLAGVTPTRPFMYLAGYMGGVGFHVEDDGLQFLNLCLPIPSVEATGLPNVVEWNMEETDDIRHRIQRAASGVPKDKANKLFDYYHSKRNLDQGLAQQQPGIKQAPVCSNLQEPLGSGSRADLVMGNLGHSVVAAGGWGRISNNFANPSHLLMLLAGYKLALIEEQRQGFFQPSKWEGKRASPLLLTNCVFAALCAPPGHLCLSPTQMESFVALVLLLLMRARKDRYQLASLLQASSSKKQGSISTPTHTPAAGASTAATAAAAPCVPQVAVVHARAPHLTVPAAILGMAQAGAAGTAGSACLSDLSANHEWLDAFSCRAHRKDGGLCDAAAGCVGCTLQQLLIQQAQQGQQQEFLQSQDAEQEGKVRQQGGVHATEKTGQLGQPGQQQQGAEAQDEGKMAERNPKCSRQHEDQDGKRLEQVVETAQESREQGQEECSAAQAMGGPKSLAQKRGQQQSHHQGPAQPAKKARKQQHGQAPPRRRGAASHNMQPSEGHLRLTASWHQRMLCLPPKAQDPTAQELNKNTAWKAYEDHQCEVCGSDLELQRAVLVPRTHPLAALVTQSRSAEEENQIKQPARRGKTADKVLLQEHQQHQHQHQPSSHAAPLEQLLASWNASEEQRLEPPDKYQVRRICLGCLVDRRHASCKHKWLGPEVSAAVLLVRQHSLGELERRLQEKIKDVGGAELLRQAVAKLFQLNVVA